MAGKSEAVIFDIDGTLALRGDRGPFDWKRVGEDLPNGPVVRLAQWIQQNPYWITIYMSGRDGICREQTEMWLDAQGLYPDLLLMRNIGDNRKDSIVKEELYRTHVEPFWTVKFVVDDRDQVVRMWREELGLTCLQVAYGDF